MDAFASLKEKFRTDEQCRESSCKDEDAVAVPGQKVAPPSRAAIGRAAWRYIHTMAANAPQNPGAEEQVRRGTAESEDEKRAEEKGEKKKKKKWGLDIVYNSVNH